MRLMLRGLGIAVLILCFSTVRPVRGSAPDTASAPAEHRVWPSTPPADCPFPPSKHVTGIAFTGRHAEYTGADTWYPSWAADGNLYSPWTDGKVHDLRSNSGSSDPTTGHATILGDDPMHLSVVEPGLHHASAAPYGGRYPCGSLVYDGIWYYGTYCLMNLDGSRKATIRTPTGTYNWGVLGPFMGFRISRDHGKTWTETPHTPANPLFPEPEQPGGPVKIGAPHFVDFGRNMEHSPDGYAYLVGHGAVEDDPHSRPANLSWITGDRIYLIRVKPRPDIMNDVSQYQFFAGHDAEGRPRWSHDFNAIKPLVEWNNRCGCVTMTYIAPLKKYVMCVTDGWPTVRTFDTWFLESDRMTGPWKLVSYFEDFGEQAYFVNIPSKFISADGTSMWLCYSANFTISYPDVTLRPRPPGSRYALCLQQIRLRIADDAMTSEKTEASRPAGGSQPPIPLQ